MASPHLLSSPGGFCHNLWQWSSIGDDCTPGGHLAASADSFGCQNFGGPQTYSPPFPGPLVVPSRSARQPCLTGEAPRTTQMGRDLLQINGPCGLQGQTGSSLVTAESSS